MMYNQINSQYRHSQKEAMKIVMNTVNDMKVHRCLKNININPNNNISSYIKIKLNIKSENNPCMKECLFIVHVFSVALYRV